MNPALFPETREDASAVMAALHLATFATEVTPPVGHPLCGGWIEPVRAVDDTLRALGVVLLGMGQPVVLCALDWCGVRNEAHQAWRKALAEAAHTAPSCVAVQCVHPHNAPFADLDAERLLQAAHGPPSLDLKFHERAVAQTAEALRESLARTVRFTHVGLGQAKIDRVASNRRVLGPDGKVKYVRYSATKDPKIQAEPEGLIDPWLKTLSFWDREKPLAALHYYATHPMSYYGDGRVTSDFCGLARDARSKEMGIFQVYFTGCAGNITAGKYNDGAKENRPVLRDRIYAAMKTAWEATKKQEIKNWEWRVEPVKLPPRREKSFGEEEARRVLADTKESKARRGNAAFLLAWLKRIERPIDFTCLDLGVAQVLHLPGEPFIQYQLKAQELKKDSFVCVAGYGDDGPGYIPTDAAFLEGGYEPTVALAAPSQRLMTDTIAKLLNVPSE